MKNRLKMKGSKDTELNTKMNKKQENLRRRRYNTIDNFIKIKITFYKMINFGGRALYNVAEIRSYMVSISIREMITDKII